MAFMKHSGEVVTGTTTSQAVLAGEKDPTEMRKCDLVHGHRTVNLAAVERKVLVPGAKTRGQAETSDNMEVPDGG